MKKVVIVGGGFGGLRAALELAKSNKEINIKLVSDKPHFEYHPSLYRVVTGKSPLQVCIPLSEVFKGKPVELCEDKITRIDLREKVIFGKDGVSYEYDYLVLALGSQTNYFNLPGIRDLSYGFKSIKSALRLKNHLHGAFENKKETYPGDRDLLHVVIVGGGTSGVELAGELAVYTKLLSKNHNVSENRVKIEIIEAGSALVNKLPRTMSRKIQKRLEELGVLVFLNEKLIKEDFEKVYIESGMIKTNTLIWTAGVSANLLYKEADLKLASNGKVVVNEYLQASNFSKVYILGDGANTKFSGMGQTADYDGRFAAANILKALSTEKLEKYEPKQPAFALPVGKGWAAVKIGEVKLYGFFGWILRKAADFRYFLSILPTDKAILAFSEDGKLCETCSLCIPVQADISENEAPKSAEVIESLA